MEGSAQTINGPPLDTTEGVIMAKKKKSKATKKPQFILKMEADDKARQKDWEGQYNTAKSRKMAGEAIDAYKED